MLKVCICKMNELIFLGSLQCPKPLIRNQYNFGGARKAKVLLWGLGLAKKEKKKGRCGWCSQEHVVWVDQENSDGVLSVYSLGQSLSSEGRGSHDS